MLRNFSLMEKYNKVKPYLGVVFLQLGYSGLSILAKFGLNNGMSHYTFAVYRNAVAAVVIAPFALLLERKVRPRMTISIFFKIMLLGLLDPVLAQNLYYGGMNYATATFSAAMFNILPAMTFALAWIFRFEKVDVRRLRSQARVVGTLVTVGGAMIMTLVKGPLIDLPWTKAESYGHGHAHDHAATMASSSTQPDTIKGALLMAAGCFCWAAFYILQAFTLKSYPAALSLTTLICMMGSLQGTILTVIVEKGNMAIWALHWDTKLLAAVYGGIVCSGISYYVSGVLMKEKGPVFVAAFNPLTMVIVAIMGSFILAEQIFMGGVVGAIVIVVGLYLVSCDRGKRKDEHLCKLDNEAPIDQHCNEEAEISVHGSAKGTKVILNDEAV